MKNRANFVAVGIGGLLAFLTLVLVLIGRGGDRDAPTVEAKRAPVTADRSSGTRAASAPVSRAPRRVPAAAPAPTPGNDIPPVVPWDELIDGETARKLEDNGPWSVADIAAVGKGIVEAERLMAERRDDLDDVEFHTGLGRQYLKLQRAYYTIAALYTPRKIDEDVVRQKNEYLDKLEELLPEIESLPEDEQKQRIAQMKANFYRSSASAGKPDQSTR